MLVAQLGVDARRAVGLARVGEDASDQRAQLARPRAPARGPRAAARRSSPRASRRARWHSRETGCCALSASISRKLIAAIGLPGEESRGLLQDLPLLAQRAFSRRSRRSSSRSSLVRPSRLPSSISACSTQRRSDSGATPSSSATALIRPPAHPVEPHRLLPELRREALPLATSTPFRTLARPSSGCQRNRVNSSAARCRRRVGRWGWLRVRLGARASRGMRRRSSRVLTWWRSTIRRRWGWPILWRGSFRFSPPMRIGRAGRIASLRRSMTRPMSGWSRSGGGRWLGREPAGRTSSTSIT